MKIGDIVNIKTINKGVFWKGKITKIKEEYSSKIKYLHPIAIVESIENNGYSTMIENDFIFKDGEYWEK